jgi:hypothetical protein
VNVKALGVACALLLAAAMLCMGAPAGATATTPARAPRATTRRPAAAKPAAADSLRSGSRLAPRTLDDIHIEGEIPVPQVMFITARDQRRFMEFQHHRYTRTSLELGRGTAMPSRIVVPEVGPVVGKENPR